jgi:GTP cyclohydrolase IA
VPLAPSSPTDGPYPAADVPALRVVRDTRPPDMAAATRAARALLEALGLDTATEGMADTPGRMARAYAELFTPRPFAATTFPTTRATRGWCWPGQFHCGRSASTICCRSPAWPMSATLPGDRILGLAKLARLVEHFTARPQVQERLTQQIADWLDRELDARGSAVVLDAEHTCMTMRACRLWAPGR